MAEEPQKIAIVTGGSRGIGRAIVQLLARRGLRVFFTYRSNEDAARELERSLEAEGHFTKGQRVDAADIAATGAFVKGVAEDAGRLDVLVNNAGVTADRPLLLMSESDWSAVLSTSLNALFGGTKPAVREMLRQRSGRIINVTSVSGLIGVPGQTNYCSAKAGIIGFTRALSKEVAQAGVAVNAVAPGFIDTDMLSGFNEKQHSAALAKVPMGRFGTSDEVANLVAYLAIEAPSFLTGQTLVIDGGMTA